MPENLLGLREHPFAAAHDPRFLHLTAEHEEALARLRHGLAGGEPFLLVTGESGIGKTSIVQAALGDDAEAVFLPNPALEPRELIEELCLRFEVQTPKNASKPQMTSRLEGHLAELQSAGFRAILGVDEAQNATPELLEELRLLTNLEVQGRPLLQIVLMGLPELERNLARPEMHRLRQRVATHVRLGPLSAEDTEKYIRARLRAAGGDGAKLFPRETCLEIHRLARGVPRAINTIAGEALLKASLESAKAVAAEQVQSSAADSWLRSVSDGASRPDASAARPEDGLSPMDDLALGQAVPHATTPDVKEWVSRFVDPSRPVRIGGAILAERAAEASRREWEEIHGSVEDADLPSLPEGASGELPPPRARPRPRRGRSSRLPLSLSILVLGGVATFLAVRWMPRLSLRPAPQSASTPAKEQAPTQAARTEPAVETPPVVERETPKRAPAAQTQAPAPEAPPQPLVRRGVEAGSYLNPERAQEERTRLAEVTGLPVRIIEGEEYGATVYRVVIGSFGSRRRATRALEDLVERGLIEQAKVVSLPVDESTQR